MKKMLYTTLLMLICITLSTFAQDNSKKEMVIIKPKVIIGDLIFVYNVLNTIDISGQEVDAFLECRTFFKNIIETADKEKRKLEDEITVDMPLVIGQNLSVFLKRGKFKGEQADFYKRFMEALVASAEKLNAPK